MRTENFKFQNIFKENAATHEVFYPLTEFVDKAILGKPCTIFAYG